MRKRVEKAWKFLKEIKSPSEINRLLATVLYIYLCGVAGFAMLEKILDGPRFHVPIFLIFIVVFGVGAYVTLCYNLSLELFILKISSIITGVSMFASFLVMIRVEDTRYAVHVRSLIIEGFAVIFFIYRMRYIRVIKYELTHLIGSSK